MKANGPRGGGASLAQPPGSATEETQSPLALCAPNWPPPNQDGHTQDVQAHWTVFTLFSKCPNGLFTSIISLTNAIAIPWAIAVFVLKNTDNSKEGFCNQFWNCDCPSYSLPRSNRDHPHNRNRSANRTCKWTLKAWCLTIWLSYKKPPSQLCNLSSLEFQTNKILLAHNISITQSLWVLNVFLNPQT